MFELQQNRETWKQRLDKVKLKNTFLKREGRGGKKVLTTLLTPASLSVAHGLLPLHWALFTHYQSKQTVCTMDICLTAAREDTVCICQEMNKHLQLSQQKKRSKNTENSDTSVTWVMTWTLDSLSRRNSNIWLAVLFLLTCNLLIYSFYILYLIF